MQALLSALLLVTTFYSAGLGVFSYLNARNILEDARRSAVEAKEAYPLVADMEEQIEQLIKRFDLMFPDVDWSQGFNADPQVKQEVLYYERALALFEFLNIRSFREGAAEAYRGIGSYYGRKFGSEDAKNRSEAAGANAVTADPNDYQRALFYLDKAVETDGNVRTLNDRGNLAITRADYDKAEKCFEQSRLLDPDHQRALYNLALIWHRRGKEWSSRVPVTDAVNAFNKSIRFASDALKLRRWQKIEETPYQADLRYNRACAYACLAAIDPRRGPELLRKAAADLAHPDMIKAFREDTGQLPEALRKDIESGDLLQLANADAVLALLRLRDAREQEAGASEE